MQWVVSEPGQGLTAAAISYWLMCLDILVHFSSSLCIHSSLLHQPQNELIPNRADGFLFLALRFRGELRR